MNIIETQKQTPLPPLSTLEQQQDIQKVKDELTKHLEEKQEIYRLSKRIKEPLATLEDTLENEFFLLKNLDSLDTYTKNLKPLIAELQKVNTTIEELLQKNSLETLKFLFRTRTKWDFELMVDFACDICIGDKSICWEDLFL